MRSRWNTGCINKLRASQNYGIRRSVLWKVFCSVRWKQTGAWKMQRLYDTLLLTLFITSPTVNLQHNRKSIPSKTRVALCYFSVNCGKTGRCGEGFSSPPPSPPTPKRNRLSGESKRLLSRSLIITEQFDDNNVGDIVFVQNSTRLPEVHCDVGNNLFILCCPWLRRYAISCSAFFVWAMFRL